MHILYVAAASRERAQILKRLRRSRYEGVQMDVHAASSVREATYYLREHMPDACVVDLTLLSGSPVKILRRLKRASPGTAFILAVDARYRNLPPVDSVLHKPFTVRVFKARLTQALNHRKAAILRVGPFTLDQRTRTLVTPRGTFHLRPIETRLMREFMQHPNEVLDRRYLIESVWETSFLGDTRTLDVHVHWLRKKIEGDIEEPQYIITVYGIGYKLQVKEREEEETT